MKTLACIDAATMTQLLQQSLEPQQQQFCEQHLEACARCRGQLEQLAGSPDWWQQAAEMLSGEERESGIIANETRSRLSPSGQTQERAAILRQVRQILEPASHPELLGRLGNYEIESFIGQGGFGVVFKAHDAELNRPVAIKVLAPHLSTSGVARRRFAREAQAAAAVVHPNVVPIHAVFSEAECPYLVMTYVPGVSLQQFVQQHGPQDAKSVVRIGQQVAAGLAAAHRQGLVHRDIKPGNILLENGLSRSLITDFGLARAADDAAASQTGWLAGTPHYMSPEQAGGGDLDGRSDLFSLGSVMYFLATGREPFRGQQPLAILQQIATHRPMSAHLVNSDVPRTLSRIIDRLLEKRPQDRFQSAQELSELLEEYLAHMQQPQAHAKPRLPVSRRQWQQWLRWSAAGVFSAAFGWWGIPMLWQSAWAAFTQPAAVIRESEMPTESLQMAMARFRAAQVELQDHESGCQSIVIELADIQNRVGLVEQAWLVPASQTGLPSAANIPMDSWQLELNRLQQDVNRLEIWQWQW